MCVHTYVCRFLHTHIHTQYMKAMASSIGAYMYLWQFTTKQIHIYIHSLNLTLECIQCISFRTVFSFLGYCCRCPPHRIDRGVRAIDRGCFTV